MKSVTPATPVVFRESKPRTPRRAHERKAILPAQSPTAPDTLSAITDAFGPDVAKLVNWAIRATVEETLRRERRSLASYAKSVEVELKDIVAGSLHDVRALGHLEGVKNVGYVLACIEPREILHAVVMRFDAVARRKTAELAKLRAA